MGAGRHGDDTNLLGIETALLGLASDHAHGTLSVFPGRLVYGQTHGSRGSVDEVHALESQLGELLVPFLDEAHIAAVLVAAARNENHAAAVVDFLSRSVEPFQISHTMFVGLEVLLAGFVGHGRNLMVLLVGHLALGPYGLSFLCRKAEANEQSGEEECNLFHISIII